MKMKRKKKHIDQQALMGKDGEISVD